MNNQPGKPKDAPEPSALHDTLEELNRYGYIANHTKGHETRLYAVQLMWDTWRRIVADMGVIPEHDGRLPGVWVLRDKNE